MYKVTLPAVELMPSAFIEERLAVSPTDTLGTVDAAPVVLIVIVPPPVVLSERARIVKEVPFALPRVICDFPEIKTEPPLLVKFEVSPMLIGGAEPLATSVALSDMLAPLLVSCAPVPMFKPPGPAVVTEIDPVLRMFLLSRLPWGGAAFMPVVTNEPAVNLLLLPTVIPFATVAFVPV